MAIIYNSNYNGTTPFSDVCFQINCATNAEEIVTVPGLPTNKYQALFSYNQSANVFVRMNAVPVVPASGVVGTEQYNEFRPDKRYVSGGDVIHVITPDTNAYVGISLMSIS